MSVSLTLDDLRRAAYEEARGTADYLWPNAPAFWGRVSLAAVERFAEHLSHTECGLCESGDPPVRDDGGAFWHLRGRVCTATNIHRLLSSLRGEIE